MSKEVIEEGATIEVTCRTGNYPCNIVKIAASSEEVRDDAALLIDRAVSFLSDLRDSMSRKIKGEVTVNVHSEDTTPTSDVEPSPPDKSQTQTSAPDENEGSQIDGEPAKLLYTEKKPHPTPPTKSGEQLDDGRDLWVCPLCKAKRTLYQKTNTFKGKTYKNWTFSCNPKYNGCGYWHVFKK